MVHLKKKYRQLGILFTIILLLLQLGCSTGSDDQSNNNDEWNTDVDDNQPFDYNPLYNLTEVPTLDKLFVNSTFIKQVTIENKPYLHGYSFDGLYAAFISFSDKYGNSYLISIYNIQTGELSYSTYIPITDKILESKELAIAQQTITNAYKINIVPEELYWHNNMEYQLGNETWIIGNEEDEQTSYLQIYNKETKRKWNIYSKLNLYLIDDVQLFTIPEYQNKLIFIKNNNENNSNIFTPLFIDLNKFTTNNSESGRDKEADNWLYGDYKFIYNQWGLNDSRGFLAISTDNDDLGNVGYSNIVQQWVYLDNEGRMKWYGNEKGIFNYEGKPLQPLDKTFYYRINVISGLNSSFNYLIIDQYDKKTKKIIRTIEFKWNKKNNIIQPIQNISVYE